VQDPVLKAQVEQMWSKLGVDTSAGTPAAPAPPAASPDVAGDLERLQKLRDSGILTEDEFTAQRAKILNSI
ncbi:MAG TPA: SHOCT domain-containing protein, partial [Acidimicrobiales bacterium]